MKRIKKLLSYLLVVTVLLSTCLFTQVNIGADASTMRDLTAFELVSEMKIGVNIGNSLDSVGSSETSWGNPKITKELIKTYKELGFNTIRLPVTWRTHMDSNGVPDSAWLNRVKEVVDWILEEDLYCIINTHHEQNWLNTNSTNMDTRKKKFANLWANIAEKFKNYGDHLLFEAFNEILKAESDWSHASYTDYQNSNELAQVFVNTIRESGGNNAKRILVISTYGAIREVDGFSLPTDTVPNKLAVEFHSYDPQGFCFAGSKSTWNTSDGGIIDSYCRLFYENFICHGVPVILGEFGAVDKSNEYDRSLYAKKVVTSCVKYGLKPIYWDDGGDFKLINRSSYNALFPSIISALVDNASTGILPSATTYTIVTQPPVTYSQVPTTPKTTTTTTKPNIVVEKVEGLVLNVISSSVIDIGWNYVDFADYYNIYRSYNGGEFELYSNTYNNSFCDTKLNTDDYYEYKITACRKYGDYLFESDYSDVVSFGQKEVGILSDFNLKDASVNSVKLSWKAVENATKYVIFRAKNNAVFKEYKTTSALSLVDKKLTRGAKYSYYVIACDSNNIRLAKSNELSSVVLAKYIGKITSKSYKKYISFNIDKVLGASGYEIKYSLDKKLKNAKIKTFKNTKAKIKGLKKGSKYYFSVRAYKLVNNKKVYTNAKKISVITKQ